MNRITQKFDELKQQGRKGLVGYLTAGDPNLHASERNIREALANGLDIVEIGVPFSDPTADGPTIQAAGRRALNAGINLDKILAMCRRIRRTFETPMILFSYANPLLAYGYAQLCADAAAAGIDGLLVVDMPFEESGELRGIMRRHGLLFIALIAPTTSKSRAEAILSQSDGFVYYIMVKGVTGARHELPPEVAQHIAQLRTCTHLPIAAGFGIGSAAQARAAARHADAVVVGSALIEAAQAGRLGAFIRELADAVHGTA